MKATLLALAFSAASFVMFIVAAREPPRALPSGIHVYCVAGGGAESRLISDGDRCSVGSSIGVKLVPARRAIVEIGVGGGRAMRTRANEDGVAAETLPLAASELGNAQVRVFVADGDREERRTLVIDVSDSGAH